MWWWLLAVLVLLVAPFVRVLRASHGTDLGTVSTAWLTRHRADRRSTDY